ncbi:DNA-binding response OmpR family regulator [Streptomyces sp. B1I3]|nr:DNA-binding response OmpR family regulator [Streptomyces sp. B1I3]
MPCGGVLLRGVGEEGFTTLTAQDGAGALRLAGDTVDAVVLDVGLTDADGRDVCQTSRANGFFAPDTPHRPSPCQ